MSATEPRYLIVGADGQQYGPYGKGELAELLRDGRATAESRVWAEGMAEWVPLRTVVPAPAALPAPPIPVSRDASAPPPPQPQVYSAPEVDQRRPKAEDTAVPGRGGLLFFACILVGFGLLGSNFIFVAGGVAMFALWFLVPSKPAIAMWTALGVYGLVAVTDIAVNGYDTFKIVIRVVILITMVRDAMLATAWQRERDGN